MKKLIAFLTVLALLSCSISAFADAGWICPKCGKELPATAKFCPNDRSERPAADNSWACSNCGQTGNTGKFCPNCAAPKPDFASDGSWDCSNCGQIGNNDNFCSNCAAPKGGYTPTPTPTKTPTPTPTPTRTPTPTPTPTRTPTPTPTPTRTPTPTPTPIPRTFEISTSVSADRGHFTVSWTDTANASPYQVAFEYADGGSAVQSSFWAGGNESSSTTYSKSFTIDFAIPGRKYIIKVTDKNGKQIKQTVRMPYASEFVDGKLKASSLKVSTEYRYMTKAGDYSNTKSLSKLKASEMMSNMDKKGYEYGLRYKVEIPQLSHARSYDYLLAFYAPNGYAYCYHGNIDFNYYKNQTSWYAWYCEGGFFFQCLYEKNSKIPTGTYTVELYLDGMKVNTSTFQIQ